MPANRTKTHDLYDFMQQITDEMAAEYDRIQKRATEDPGTAGDQGEENWAELLRLWLCNVLPSALENNSSHPANRRVAFWNIPLNIPAQNSL